MGPQNLISLKYWVNDQPGCMIGIFYNSKILLKIEQRVSLHKTSKMGLIFMNMSSMVLGLLDQLQIFWQTIELLGLLTGVELLELSLI